MAKRFKNIYQFKVVLEGIHPSIWRTIQVPESYSFWDLHVAIQDAMGWWDSHLHAFRLKDPASGEMTFIGIPGDDGSDGAPDFRPGWEIAIKDFFEKPGDSAHYEYDFGDGWEHRLVLEEIAPKKTRARYPRCLAGARACPPEDCGGVPGYESLLRILADPTHEEHEDMLTWVGGFYDADAFDPKAVRFDNPERRWQTAFGEQEPEAKSVLEAFLSDPSRPAGSMTHREVYGFIFAVACAPDVIVPSEWVPQIFGSHEPDFESGQQAKQVFAELTDIYNTLRADADTGQTQLPHHCWFYQDVLANFEEDAPMAQWSRGFFHGHAWLKQSWGTTDPDHHDLPVAVTTLAFFSSRKAAERGVKESNSAKLTLVALSEKMREIFLGAMDRYAEIGQSLYRALLAQQKKPAVRGGQPERNAPCPCGSGKKFKKCCLDGGPVVTH